MSYQQQLVRDLAWLIGSPGLIRDDVPDLPVPTATWRLQLIHDTQDLLAQWDRDPTPLHEWCHRHSEGARRLGHYAQALLSCVFHHLPDRALIQSRTLIHDAGRTVGEVDLIFTEATAAAMVLWEVAVKFYLGNPPDTQPMHWLAPHPRQCLRDKLDRITHHQIPVARAYAATLPPAGSTRCEAFLAGWLFHPLPDGDRDLPTADPTLPASIRPDHARGWWLRHGAQTLARSTRAARLRILEPSAWMSPARSPAAAGDLLAPRQLETALNRHFASSNTSVLVAEMVRDHEGWWSERRRLMVVDPAWPRSEPI